MYICIYVTTNTHVYTYIHLIYVYILNILDAHLQRIWKSHGSSCNPLLMSIHARAVVPDSIEHGLEGLATGTARLFFWVCPAMLQQLHWAVPPKLSTAQTSQNDH